jgi:PAS domain S-box-containing protein
VELFQQTGDATRQPGREELFALLVRAVKEYAIFMLDTEGCVVTWNEGAQLIKGYTADEIIGRHFSTFYTPEDIAVGKPTRELAEATQTGRVVDEGWRVRKDGSRFWANVTITALFDDDGALRGFGKVTRDLTLRKRMEDERVDAERRIAAELRLHAQKLEAVEHTKSNILNLASHELRGPLTILHGYLSMLTESDRDKQAELAPRVLPILLGKTRDMQRLVNEMLEAVRLDEDRLALRRSIIDLGSRASLVAISYRDSLDSRHELVLQVAKDVLVHGDAERIETIISNLLSNAVKYSPGGGEIACRVFCDSPWAVVQIEDHGMGIDPADFHILFTRFGRIVTRENAHIAGTGLGLYLCRELAHRHDGEVTVTSAPGVGSTFTLRLPLYAP